MRYEAWTTDRVMGGLQRLPLLSGSVVVLLMAGGFSVAVGTLLGLQNFQDVGYPDSAILLRIGEFLHSGQLYPDFDRPPYLVTMYGPLTYVLLGLPYALAEAAGFNPQGAVRLAVVGALCLCVLFIFLISMRLYRSFRIAWLCVLFAVSSLPLADWTTQIRGDFLALAFSLLSIYLFLLTNGRWQSMGASVCAGIALLIKQTFLAAPIAIIIWLGYKRRYKDAAFWAVGVALTVVSGYAVVLWREPLMLKHYAVLRYLVLDYDGALDILWQAMSQPLVLFAVPGGFLALWEHATERGFFLIFCIMAWLIAILTIPQVGGNINYFWEPLLATAMLAGSGLWELQRRGYRTPMLVTGMFLVLLLWQFRPMLKNDLKYLRQSYQQVRSYQLRKARWASFVSIVSGHRLLSTLPAVTIHSRSPEMPDPYLNSMLELRGRWNSSPVVAEINAGKYELIVIRKGQSDRQRGYRGVRLWSEEMWSAMKRTYRLACVFEDLEIWLPRQSFGEVLTIPVLEKQLCNGIP